MTIDRCTKEDFDRIASDHALYWDSPLTLPLHHPMLIFEFGDTAFVVKDGETIAAYLFGFFAQTGPVAYVHLVAVHPRHRRQGLARRLYDHFISIAIKRGCRELKATAAPTNRLSIAFHLGMGMEMLGEPWQDGVSVVRGYLKPGTDRVVFRMALPQA